VRGLNDQLLAERLQPPGLPGGAGLPAPSTGRGAASGSTPRSAAV